MTAGTAHEARHTPPISIARLWFGMLGGIIAWAIGFFLSYPLSARCDALGEVGVLVVTGVTIAVTAAATLVAWRNWRAVRGTSETGSGGWAGQAAFMSFAGLLLSGVALALIVSHAIPLLLLEPCIVL